MSSDKLAPFLDSRYLNLETYRKNGHAVKTPVWFVVADEIIFIITTPNTGKVKRLHHNKTVRIVPSNFKGEPKGEWVEGSGYFANESDSKLAIKVRKEKYGFLVNLVSLFTSRKGNPIVIGIKI